MARRASVGWKFRFRFALRLDAGAAGRVGWAEVASSPMLVIEGLGKRYGDFSAVRDLNLQVAEGEIFALLGPNGAGKTTTLRILMGFLKASAGRARIAQLDCFEERVALKRIVGYLPDDPSF